MSLREQTTPDQYRLAPEIIALSDASTWDEAKLEWSLEKIYRQEDSDTCLCGHRPIKEICIIRNDRNGAKAIVGNECVNKFLGLNSKKLFDAVRRIRKDVERALNAEVIEHAYERGWLNKWERDFYFDTWRKNKPTSGQMKIRTKLNRRVIARIDSGP